MYIILPGTSDKYYLKAPAKFIATSAFNWYRMSLPNMNEKVWLIRANIITCFHFLYQYYSNTITNMAQHHNHHCCTFLSSSSWCIQYHWFHFREGSVCMPLKISQSYGCLRPYRRTGQNIMAKTQHTWTSLDPAFRRTVKHWENLCNEQEHHIFKEQSNNNKRDWTTAETRSVDQLTFASLGNSL